MNLEALWSFEKNRITVQFEENSPTQLPRPSDVLAGSFMALIDPDKTRLRNDKKRLISLAAKREIISTRLLEESAVPKVGTNGHKLFDANGFAMEYEDHAPRRMNGTNASWVNRIVNGLNAGASFPKHAEQVDALVNHTTAASGPLSKNLVSLNALAKGNVGGGGGGTMGSGTTHEDKAKRKTTSTSVVSSSTGNNITTTTSNGSSPPKKDAGGPLRPMTRLSLASKTSKSGSKRLRAKKSFLETNEKVLRHYEGDMFSTRGEYVDGILYMSRMKRSSMMEDVREKDTVKRDGLGSSLDNGTARGAASSRTKHSVIKEMVSDAIRSRETDVDDKAAERSSALLKHQQRCALTLSNWTSNSANAQLMIEENAIQALIRLCKPDDLATRISCATAFMNLSLVYQLRSAMVQQGAVRTVSQLVAENDNKRLRTACAITLANLCSLDGNEENIVGDGAVAALSVLLNELPSVSILCQSALFNLTCVREPYHKIESVLKTFVTLASQSASSMSFASPSSVQDDIVGKALCNLSNFKRIRLRLMEEGILSALSSLIQSNSAHLDHLPAYILMNLSEVRNCRSEMVAKGAMTSLSALASVAKDFETKRLVAITLLNLSKEEGNRLRMVLEGLLTIFSDLCAPTSKPAVPSDEVAATTGDKQEVLRGICARALYNVSCSEETRVKLVEREVIGVLTWLSKGINNGDAKKMCTVTLCNLLSVQQAASDIVHAGAIDTLIQLSMAPNQTLETKYLFAKALHGLCERESTRDAVTGAGIIPAILYLSSIPSKEAKQERPHSSASAVERKKKTGGGVLSEIRTRCVAALSYLAGNSNSVGKVSNASVVHGVTDMLRVERGHVSIERFCCACLSLLSRDEECSRIMAEDGSIDVVLATCRESNDLISKACGCQVLASISYHPSCVKALVDAGVMKVLSTLAKIRDPGIQRSCASTLANLSREPAVRDVLVRDKSVGIVAVLSNSYSEESQRDCARILCNLSFLESSENALVNEGSLNVLLMISMVRALNATTKETCMKAFVNLIGSTTVEAAIEEGLIKVLPALASLESRDAIEISTYLYGKLLCFPQSRDALCSERSALQSLFGLMERMPPSTNEKLCCVHENLLGELVHHENSRERSVQAGVVDTVNKVLLQRELTCSASNGRCKRLSMVLFTLAKYDSTRMAVASVSTQTTLASFLAKRKESCDSSASSDAIHCECSLYALGSFCYLSWHANTFEQLDRPEVVSALVNTLNVSDQMMTIKICLLTLCCLSWSTSHCETMLRCHVINHLYAFFQQGKATSTSTLDSQFLSLAAILLRQLSHGLLFAEALREKNSQVIPLFCSISMLLKDDEHSALDCADILCGIAFSDKIPPQLITAEVFESIRVLMSTGLTETRWRCAASILSLSCVSVFRSQLVTLGYTSLLVKEAQTQESSTTTLNTLKCCACALSNLSMFVPISSDPESDYLSVSEANRIAALMVEQGAVPALIQLSKLENEEIQEHCTLALSNLSGQSPTVDSVAVSALLSLSLRSSSLSPTQRSAGLQQVPSPSQSPIQALMISTQAPSPTSAHPPSPSSSGLQSSSHQQVQMMHDASMCRTSARHNAFGIVRPPLITNCRHKEFSTLDDEFSKLPEFEQMFGDTKALCNVRYEASNEASVSTPPVLPPLEADGDSSGAHGHQFLEEEHTSTLRRSTSFVEPNAENLEDVMKSAEYVGFPKMEPSAVTGEGGLARIENQMADDDVLKEDALEEAQEELENADGEGDGGVTGATSTTDANGAGSGNAQLTPLQRSSSQKAIKKFKHRLSSERITPVASNVSTIPTESSLKAESEAPKDKRDSERRLSKAGELAASTKPGGSGILRPSPKKRPSKVSQVAGSGKPPTTKRRSGSVMSNSQFKGMSSSESEPALEPTAVQKGSSSEAQPMPGTVNSTSLEEMSEQVKKLGLWC